MNIFEWDENIPVTANNLNEMQNIINGNITNAITPTILWENPSPLTGFSSQNITLSSDDYNYLEIYYYDWTTSKRMKSTKVLKGENILIDASFYSGSDFFMAGRGMTYNSDTSYSVANCAALYGTSSVALSQSINFLCIPVKILGYK